MRNSFQRLLITLAIAILILFVSAVPVRAGELPAPEQGLLSLTIDPIKPFVTGEHPILNIHLMSQYGKPIPKQPIIILVNGKRKARGVTDNQGTATLMLQYKYAAGTYSIVAIYPGIPSIGLPATIAKTKMVVQPAKLELHTVPPTPGVVFRLNDQTFTTDEKGMTTLQVNLSGIYALRVLPIDPKKLPANTHMEFARWNDNEFSASRQIYFPRTRPLEAGFTLKYRVDQEFHDTLGRPVDPARVTSFVLKGGGQTFSFDKAGPAWLPVNQLIRRIGEHLESEEIFYYVQDVEIDGGDVINKSEQRFQIKPNDVWPIRVLLYTVEFSARDAVFHRPIGRGIELTYPDGHKQQFLFNSSNAELTIPALARGSYSARIIGAGGSIPVTPIHLSRDQSVELLMLSYLDIALLVGIPLLIALAFFFLGRPVWFRVLLHPSKYRELVYQYRRRDVSL